MWDSSILYSIKPKLDIGSFGDFFIFTCFYQFLHNVIIKLFCRSKQNNFMITSCKNWGFQGKSAKSTSNPMSSFGLIEYNLELSHQLYCLNIYTVGLKVDDEENVSLRIISTSEFGFANLANYKCLMQSSNIGPNPVWNRTWIYKIYHFTHYLPFL